MSIRRKMHGRVRGSINQEARDGLRRKAAMFSQLCSVIDKSRTSGDKSEKSLQLTSKMLKMNPDCYSWWNYRREILIDLYEGEGEGSLGLLREATFEHHSFWFVGVVGYVNMIFCEKETQQSEKIQSTKRLLKPMENQ